MRNDWSEIDTVAEYERTGEAADWLHRLTFAGNED